MQIGSLVIDWLSEYIGIITAECQQTDKYYVQFFNTYDGEELSDWYIAQSLEVICR